MERCGKRNASNSGSESWIGIGVVAGFCTVVLIMQWPHERRGKVTWGSELLQRLQEVRTICKTRNQLIDKLVPIALQRLVTTRRVGREPTARAHRDVGRLLDRLDREIFGRVEDDGPLATDPGDDRRSVFVVMPATGLALLAAPPRATP